MTATTMSRASLQHLTAMISMAEQAVELFSMANASKGVEMQKQVDAAKIHATLLRVQLDSTESRAQKGSPAQDQHAASAQEAAPDTQRVGKSPQELLGEVMKVVEAAGPLFELMRKWPK